MMKCGCCEIASLNVSELYARACGKPWSSSDEPSESAPIHKALVIRTQNSNIVIIFCSLNKHARGPSMPGMTGTNVACFYWPFLPLAVVKHVVYTGNNIGHCTGNEVTRDARHDNFHYTVFEYC